MIKTLFQNFHKVFSYLEFEELMRYFSVLGGVNLDGKWDYIGHFNSTLAYNFTHYFENLEGLIAPSYILESPYKELLSVIAKGEGKVLSSFKKANLSASIGYRLLDDLIALNIVTIEYSRETPLKSHPKQKVKKEYRRYQIQDKIRFVKPFYRFWFGFVVGYEEKLLIHQSDSFIRHFEKYQERLSSLVYEQLCNELLKEHFKKRVISCGSYWNIQSEFDIVLVTKNRKLIVGECKYKNRKVCKNELNKLKSKALILGEVESYALFSKNGFSKELLSLKDEKLLLFELEDLKALLD